MKLIQGNQFKIVIILTFLCKFSFAVTEEVDDLSITYEEKDSLDKFRNLVLSRLPHEYMKTDIYLIRWLRAKKFDIAEAEKMLMDNLEWREENDIDNILSEDWAEFDAAFPADFQGCDKNGRGVISIRYGDWDLRRITVSGKTEQMKRYCFKMLEDISTFLRRAQTDGGNMTQARLIFDMSNFNLIVQGCPQCISINIHYLLTMEKYYPGITHSSIIVNAPQVFVTIWQLTQGLFSAETRSQIVLYGKNRNEWRRDVLKWVDASELSKEYGGDNDDGITMEELKAGISTAPFLCSRVQEIRKVAEKMRENVKDPNV